MSRRGRSRGGRYNSGSGYQYHGDRGFNQHDNRSVKFSGRDEESGEYYHNPNFGSYDKSFRGGGKSRGYFRRGSGRRGASRGRGRPFPNRGNQSSNGDYVDEDGDIDMDSSGNIRVNRRVNPYPSSRPRGQKHQAGRRQQHHWSLITVIDGAALDQGWVVDAIQKCALTQIMPVQYYSDDANASFCIEDPQIAQTIRDCHKKIEAPDGSKLTILKKSCPPPITDDKIPILKEVLAERFNTQNLQLDLSDMFHDQKLRENNIELKLKIPKDQYIVMHLIGEHISGLLSLDLSGNLISSLSNLKNLTVVTPKLQKLYLAKNELRYVKELDHIRDWDLKELNIDRNPLCQHYKDRQEYVSALRNRFPNLEILDGKKLPPPVKFDLEKVTKLVPAIPNHIPPEIQTLISHFVRQYFKLYDSDRNNLLQAYDGSCIFSLAIPTSPRGPPLTQYYSHNRNFIRMKSSKTKFITLRYTKSEVCSILQQLPKTEHDIAGFFVDVPLMSPNLVKFVIRGSFKEKYSGREKVWIRAFSRSFLCLTDGKILSIINDELYIRNATIPESRAAFAKPPVTPSPSPVPEHSTTSPAPPTNEISSPDKMDMITAFAKESGMNMKYSQQCLEMNQWDYSKAGQDFLTAKSAGRIPQEAFVQ